MPVLVEPRPQYIAARSFQEKSYKEVDVKELLTMNCEDGRS